MYRRRTFQNDQYYRFLPRDFIDNYVFEADLVGCCLEQIAIGSYRSLLVGLTGRGAINLPIVTYGFYVTRLIVGDE